MLVVLIRNLVVLGYIIALVVVAVKAGRAGRKIWQSGVKEIQQTRGPTNDVENINPPNATVATDPPVNSHNYNTPPMMP